MANYYLKDFITLTPKNLLQQYFREKELLMDFPWDQDFTIDQLREAILTETDSKKVELDFKMIHQWANETGIMTLIEEARSPMHDGGLEIGEALGELENEHARAMHVWVNYRDVFLWAIELSNWENKKGKVHYYVGSGLPCKGNDTAVREALGDAIAEYYKKQSKGSRCKVEYYMSTNPTRHYFFANPEDSIKGYRTYDDDDQIIRAAYRPIFQVVFEYNAEDGDVAIHARSPKAKQEMFKAICTNVLGFKKVPNADTEVFDLTCLRNGDFRFDEDATMPVESITLKMIMFGLNKGSNQRITLEASPYKGDHRQVEAMMQRSFIAHNVKPENITVQKAKIEIKFKTVMNKVDPITFTVGSPQHSTLSDDDKSEKAKRYLRKWGILVKHKPKAETEDAA